MNQFTSTAREKGWLAKDLAARWGVHPNAISKIAKNPRQRDWDALAGLPDRAGDSSADPGPAPTGQFYPGEILVAAPPPPEIPITLIIGPALDDQAEITLPAVPRVGDIIWSGPTELRVDQVVFIADPEPKVKIFCVIT